MNDSKPVEEMSADEYRKLEGARLMAELRKTMEEWKQNIRQCWTQDEYH